MSAEEIQLVTFRLGAEEYGINIMQVQEIIRIPDIVWVPKTHSFMEGVINLREQVIPVVDLAKRLVVPSGRKTGDTRVVIANIKGNLVGLIVDSVSEVMRIKTGDIEPLPDLMASSNARCFRGIAKLDNRLIILLDLENILSDDDISKLREAVKTLDEDSRVTQPVI
ncbi:MAG: chemotaxis protein CheW [Firmicutes bacterium]|jgi:purine-binding chemotaxis protein CheW|nr:chemotaxis protein CheW [Bacillota bacterium]